MSQLENKEYHDWYWLNEYTKTFLSRGYLLDGVSAKERVIQIANYAESRLGIDGYAEKFLNYMKRGYYSLASPIWANFGIPHRGLSISCFTGDTKVIVKLEDKDFSTHLEIKDIVDRLDKGEVIYALSYNEEKKETEYKRILKAWKTKESEVVRVIVRDDNNYCVNGENIVSFKCTSDHKFLTEGGWKEAKDIAGESLITFNDTYTEVYSVEKIDGIYEVYDLTVEDNHNFFVVDSYEYDYPEEQYNDERDEWEYEYYPETDDIGVCAHNCFGSYVGDSISDIKFTDGEIGIMSKFGGGTSAYFGHVRPRGSTITNNGHSNGSYSFLPIFQSTITSVSQGSTRRGAMAVYIDIDHADIEEWLNIREDGEEIQHLHWGVCVGNDWLEEMKAGDLRKRELWAKVLRSRIRTGEPFIFFKDNVNNGTVDVYKDKNMVIHASNLCSEIMLPSSADESFVCCLSSMNLLHFDEWKDTDAVETLVYFLDVVMSDFIEQTRIIDEVNGFPWFVRARKFAERHRALGLGVLGWHSYLQRNMIPFGSFEAMQKNNQIFKLLKEKAYKASEELARRFGEPELLKGYGRRNTTLLAIAPTKSSSFILGAVSPSIEPFKSNYYIKDLAKIKVVFKNPFLERIIKERGMDTDEVWTDINNKGGSVQHLDFLTDEEKEVFKTFEEISQLSIIQQAAQRQKYVDQGQSLNITIHPDMPFKDVNKLHLTAAELGVKSIYYQMNSSAAQVFNRSLIECSSCEA